MLRNRLKRRLPSARHSHPLRLQRPRTKRRARRLLTERWGGAYELYVVVGGGWLAVVSGGAWCVICGEWWVAPASSVTCHGNV